MSPDLDAYLARWGLRRFEADEPYFQWQRECFSADEIRELHRLAERKKTGAAAETAFYDFSAHPQILPVLYSQRYDYYRTVGPLIADRIAPARAVLDAGCGPGILTSYFALTHPDIAFVGLDRSAASIRAAQQHASALSLTNMTYVCGDLADASSHGPFDLVIGSHTLLQAEDDAGLPSSDWRTFDRPNDRAALSAFESRTGLGERLDGALSPLKADGRLLAFEKVRVLGRRIGFQRALAARRLRLLEPSIPVRYRLVEEIADDGPLYHCAWSVRPGTDVPWDERPEVVAGEELYRVKGDSAAVLLARLPERSVTLRATWADAERGGIEVEAGLAGRTLAYLHLSQPHGFKALVVGPQAGRVEEVAHDLTAIRTLFSSEWPPETAAETVGDLPLYEHHGPMAAQIWERLIAKRVRASRSFTQPGGREVYVEWGQVPPYAYLYWANTFDQRQVVLVEAARHRLVEDYYKELTADGERPPIA